MSIEFVRDATHFEQLLAKNKYLVANFTALWCGPCQQVKPLIDSLYADARYAKVEIVRVDLDANQPLAAQYVVTSVPTFIFFEQGAEAHRVLGVSPEFRTRLDAFAEKARNDADAAGRGAASGTEKALLRFIPKGFGVLNGTIHFGELVALNAMPVARQDGADARSAFKLDTELPAVCSDADAQALFYVPLNNVCKVYSVLVKVAGSLAGELEVDADETQPPAVLKVWPNRPAVLSFDDAAGDATHVEKIAMDKVGADGWYEARLKYVRFQNVHSLNIFVDGADEDLHTVVERIVLVGVTGDSRDQGPLHAEEE